MTVTAAASAILISSAVIATVDAITQLVVFDVGGEVLRIDPLQINTLSPTSKERVYVISENDAQTVITRLALIQADGTELCTVDCSIDKSDPATPRSVQVRWTTEVV